jgi:hypothetical protein
MIFVISVGVFSFASAIFLVDSIHSNSDRSVSLFFAGTGIAAALVALGAGWRIHRHLGKLVSLIPPASWFHHEHENSNADRNGDPNVHQNVLRFVCGFSMTKISAPASKPKAQELKDLSEELAALSEKQADAREAEVYIRMTPQEIKDFDIRRDRISAIYVILSNNDSKRPA